MARNKVTETPYFHYHNANPKGKNAADCVFRAVSVGLNQDYATTMREMCECGLKIGYAPHDTQTIKAYLESKGWSTQRELRDANNKRIKAQNFVNLFQDETIIAIVGTHHCSLIKNKKVWDTWDCSKKPVHTYWRKLSSDFKEESKPNRPKRRFTL